MGIYNGTIRTAAELSAEARGAADAVEAGDLLAQLLPSIETEDLDYDLSAGEQSLPKSASFRAYDATAPYGKETSIGSKKGSLPASSVKFALGELAKLRLRGASEEALGNDLERKARTAGQSIAIRSILARGEALSTGAVTMSGENGLTLEIDFGRDASLSASVGTTWSNIAAPAYTDLLAGIAAYRAYNGGDPRGALASSQIINDLSLNTGFISAAKGTTSSGLTRITRREVLAVLADLGLSDVRVYDEQYTDPAGSTVRPIAADKLLLVGSLDGGFGDAGPLGVTQWGIPAEALNEAYGVPDDGRSGIFAAQFDRTDPEGSDVLGSSIFLPIPDVNKVYDLDTRV
jgi:hypothetical protein